MTPKYERLSASCQQIIHENFTNTPTASFLIRSCLSDPELLPAIINHKCNNVVLTPSGLYFDMAITVAKHLLQTHPSIKLCPKGINVYDMQVHKPLLVQDISLISNCWIEMETTITSLPADGDENPSDIALRCTFHSVTPSGVRLQTMGNCHVRFEDVEDWLSTWSLHTAIVQDRIDSLLTRAYKETSGKVRLVQSAQAYEMFESFVQYSGPYRNMKECVFDYETLEATSLLDFGGVELSEGKGGSFLWDGSCHVSGFVCNAVEKDGAKNAFISHGVGSMRISEKLRPWVEGVEVRNYVRMEGVVGDSTVLQGSVYVLQDGEIVGLWEDVRFKRIPRRVLNVFLPPGKKR